MPDERGGVPSSPDEQQQLQAKLQGLERMRVAGLVDEKQYQATRARLQEQLDALGWAPPASLGLTPPVSTPLQPAPAAPLEPPPPAYAPVYQPPTQAAAAPPAEPSSPAYAPPPPYAPPAPAAPPSGYAAQSAYAAPPPPPPPAAAAWTPPPPPPWQEPQPPRPASNLRTAIVATGVALALMATTAGSIAVVTHTTRTATPTASSAAPTASATPTPTPDAAATFAALRTAQPQPGQPLITPAQARQLVQAFWPVREQGLSQRNPYTIHAIEDASAGEWDAIGCTYGCPPPSPRPLQSQQVMVPQQTSYPAAFMAQVLTTQYHSSAAMVEIMVFTRKSASAPWFLSFDTSYSGLRVLHEFPAGSGTYDEPTPPSAAVDYTTLPSQLAAYWQYWKTNGVSPPATHFQPGAFTTQQGLDTYKAWTDYRDAGIAEHATYTGSPQDGLWSFSVNVEDGNGQIEEGDVLTCGTVRFHSLSTPLAPARTVVQDDTFEPYGDLLRPGEYTSVTVTGLHESCMLTRPGSPQVVVEGLDGEQTRVVGVPFSGSGVNA